MGSPNKEQFIIYSKNKVSASDINKKYYDNFLDYLSDTLAFNTLTMSCPQFYNIYTTFLANKKLDSITIEDVYKYLKENPKRKQLLTSFLFFMIDCHFDVHNSIYEILEFRDYILNSTHTDVVLELLSSPVKKQYVYQTNTRQCKLYFVNISDEELLKIAKNLIVKEFRKSNNATFALFFKEFSNSCPYPPTLENLNYDVYLHQIDYFKKYNDRAYFSYLNTFYYHVGLNYRPDIFAEKGIQIMNLQKFGFTSYVADGHDPVIYNPIEEIPTADKWVFIHNNQNTTNAYIQSSGCIALNFSDIKTKEYRDWVKFYIWKKVGSGNPNSYVCKLKHFFNFITDLKDGQILSIYTKPTTDLTISNNEIMAYKNFIFNQSSSNATKNTNIYIIREALFFLKKSNIIDITPAIEYSLSNIAASEKINKAKVISDEELKKIAALLNENSELNDINKLYCLIFYIALGTEFRPSQILTLTTDCVKETHKPNEYVLVSKTKTSAGEEVEQPITVYTKRHIDKIIELTKKYRDECSIPELKQFLFLIASPNKVHKRYKTITMFQFNEYLADCCSKLGIQKYTLSNLRDTYMTKAEEFIIRNQMSDMQQNVLSGHKSPTTDNKHYIDTDIKQLLESVHGLVIGDVDINGQILISNSEVTKYENEVSNGCGYCGSKSCNDFSMLDCMMCKSFVTTPDRLPYFKEQVKIINHKIEQTTIPHDKEDLVNIKRLHVSFIEKLLEIKKGQG